MSDVYNRRKEVRGHMSTLCTVFIFNFYLFILREREREHKGGRARERGREGIPSRICTDSMEPHVGHELKSRVGLSTD